MRNRSSCASGSRYVPACSIGFWVAIDHERAAHRVGDLVHRDPGLLHDLQQRGLGLRRGAVDLVGEHDRGEHRPGVEVEGAVVLVVDRHAGDVGGQQVRGELDPRVGALDGRGHRLGHRRLPGARRVLQQQVPFGQHAGQGEPDDVLLAQQRLTDVGHERVEGLGEPRALLGRHAHGGSPGRRGVGAGRGGLSHRHHLLVDRRAVLGCRPRPPRWRGPRRRTRPRRSTSRP